MMRAEIINAGILAVGKKEFRRIGREVMQDIGFEWRAKYLGRHFQRSAVQRYKYAPRSANYRRRKRKNRQYPAAREDKPLVFSGDSRHRALSERRVIAKATSATRWNARIIINAPTLNFRGMSKEVTAILPAEEAALEKSMFAGVVRRYNKLVSSSARIKLTR
jgi:hypothetical protein